MKADDYRLYFSSRQTRTGVLPTVPGKEDLGYVGLGEGTTFKSCHPTPT
jgi:hypothetical protein